MTKKTKIILSLSLAFVVLFAAVFTFILAFGSDDKTHPP